MALFDNPVDELDKAKKLEDRFAVLYERMEDDYEAFRLQPFKMPKEEGEWDNFTANTAAVLANYIINTLSSAKRKLYIPLDTEKKRERKAQANTERAAIGIINLADDYLTAVPEQVDIQSALCWDATVRGITAVRFFMYKEDRDIIPDVAIWDPLHLVWINDVTGRGLKWVAYHYYLSEEDARDLADDDSINATDNDKVRVTTVLDKEEEGLIVGMKWVKKEKHKLDYVPVSIIPVGSTRMIHSDRHEDTIRDFGESCFALNRRIFPSENRLWTYYQTAAGGAAKSPVNIEFDSDKSPLAPDDIKVNPAQKGAINLFDAYKGQKFVGRLDPPRFDHVQAVLQGVTRQLSMGGIPPVALGDINSAMPVGTTAMLTHSAQSRLWPVKKAVERQFVWLAHEILRQYTKGKFGSVNVRGTDKSAQDFEIEVTRKEIDSKWRFLCELNPSLPQDEMQQMGMAAQAVQSGLLSPQTARDRYKLADDPDLEQDKINRFMAENDARVRDWTLAKQLWEDGQKFEAMVILNSLAGQARQGQRAFGIPDEAMMPGGPGQGGPGQGGPPVQGIPQSTPPSPQGAVAPFQTLQVPPEVQEAVRLRQMGLVKGR